MCNSKPQCEELSKIIQQMCPAAQVVCHKGRRGTLQRMKSITFHDIFIRFILLLQLFSGSFEVQINEQLIHSKLASLAFPDYGDVVKNVKLAAEGQPVSKVKEQPITDCVIQ